MGMFSRCLQWISSFSVKTRPLVQANSFPYLPMPLRHYKNKKNDVANASVIAIDHKSPFVMETNSSDSVIVLSRRNVYFFFFFKDPVTDGTGILSCRKKKSTLSERH